MEWQIQKTSIDVEAEVYAGLHLDRPNVVIWRLASGHVSIALNLGT
jgi:hypothetical protein